VRWIPFEDRIKTSAVKKNGR